MYRIVTNGFYIDLRTNTGVEHDTAVVVGTLSEDGTRATLTDGAVIRVRPWMVVRQ